MKCYSLQTAEMDFYLHSVAVVCTTSIATTIYLYNQLYTTIYITNQRIVVTTNTDLETAFWIVWTCLRFD